MEAWLEKALQEILDNNQNYIGMFKPPKKLMELLTSQGGKAEITIL
jgi:hypothetical protein